MKTVSKAQVVELLHRLGIQPGDGLLVHAAIQFLGVPEGGVEMYYQAIREVIGEKGTIAVPTFNFAFARGEKYHPKQTPSQDMGVFAEYVRQLPEARRTPHPMQSLAVIGRHADRMAVCDTLSAFDPGSPFDLMVQLGFKLLLLGASILYAAIVHYSEQRMRVPYRYWKTFQGEVYTPIGWQKKKYKMFVRDLHLDPRLDLQPIQRLLEERGQWHSQPLNYGHIASCYLQDFVRAAEDLLSKDPWVLVSNPPTRGEHA